MNTTGTGFSTLDAYNFILDWAMKHKGNTPSNRQIAAACGFSHAAAQYHIRKLVEAGMLERIDNELCVTHAEFSVDKAQMPLSEPPAERIHPQVESMRYIPKDVRWMGEPGSLKDLGIVVGEAADEEWLYARYPARWKYLLHEEDEAIYENKSSWFLADGEGKYRAVLRVDNDNYQAVLFCL